MKKTYLFLLAALVFVIFACTIPSEIKVKGTIPKLMFETKTDFSEEFKKMVKDSFNGDGGSDLKTQYCTNSNIKTQTYLIRMKAIEDEFEITNTDVESYGVSGDYKLKDDLTVFDSNSGGKPPVKLSLSQFGESLYGFNFDEAAIKANIYFKSDESIIIGSKIELSFFIDKPGQVNVTPFQTDEITVEYKDGSGINLSSDEYEQNDFPDGGHPIKDFGKLVNQKEDFQLKIKVVLPKDATINSSLINHDINIIAEILVWLPMDLKAGTNGAEIEFPEETFDGVGDFIDSVSEYLESLTLEVGMNNNPFYQNGKKPDEQPKLVMVQENLKVSKPINKDGLSFALDDKDMKKIINMNNFKPAVKITFPADTHVIIPKDLKTTYVSFSAKISYMVMED